MGIWLIKEELELAIFYVDFAVLCLGFLCVRVGLRKVDRKNIKMADC
jgi:hypothetical protein